MKTTRLILGALFLCVSTLAQQGVQNTPIYQTSLSQGISATDVLVSITGNVYNTPTAYTPLIFLIEGEAIQVFGLQNGPTTPANPIGTIQYSIKRAQLGTSAVAHNAGALIWSGFVSQFGNSEKSGSCNPAPQSPQFVNVNTLTLWTCIAGTWTGTTTAMRPNAFPVSYIPFAANPFSAPDASISRPSADTFYFGNGSPSDHSAAISAGSISVGSFSCGPPGPCPTMGTVTNFSAPAGSWPTWLTPVVSNPTTTPSLSVTASTIPISAGGTGTTVASNVNITNPTYAGGADCTGTTDSLAAVNAAMAAAATGSRILYQPGGCTIRISSHIQVPLNMTGGTFYSDGNAAILPMAGYTDTSLLTGDPQLSVFQLRGLTFEALGMTSISTVVNLSRSPESSIQNLVRQVRILDVPVGATGLNLDGCEDSNVEDVEILAYQPPSTAKALSWQVPVGNIHIKGSTWFIPSILQYQNADITGSTTGCIQVGAVASTLVMNGGYTYACLQGGTYVNFFSTTQFGFGAIVNNGGYIVGSTESSTGAAVVFRGNFIGTAQFNGSVFNPGTNTTSYAVFDSNVTAPNGFTPAFLMKGSLSVGFTTVGTPGANVMVQTSAQPAASYAFAYFGGANPAVSFGTPIVHSFPIRITAISVASDATPTGCATPAIVSVNNGGTPLTSITLTNSLAQWFATGLSIPVANTITPNIEITQQAAGCSTSPVNIRALVEIQPL